MMKKRIDSREESWRRSRDKKRNSIRLLKIMKRRFKKCLITRKRLTMFLKKRKMPLKIISKVV
jgi:hypothetical protein